ncbi:ciliary microtubule associated protein 1A-like isoform X3 [Caloenas nicobarica]|uniref:ciliary microtubule associated protein 1A-like isoform X3 n=1 Tax=Caloenas nicobarica TaxID=187106 RepID=UPI0032B706C9
MDGARVGTWRPHGPWGPIMAQFTSPGPKYSVQGTTGDYCPEKPNRHVLMCPPVQSMSFRHRGIKTDLPPGPGTYTLPRVLGPSTVHTAASPCDSMRWKSQQNHYSADLATVTVNQVRFSKASAQPLPSSTKELKVHCIIQGGEQRHSTVLAQVLVTEGFHW